MVGQSNYSITLGRKVSADFKRKHRKWPLGTTVMVMTPAGYLRGRISKHWRRTENHHGATVEFPEVVDMGDANGARYCHVIPFRSMKPVPVTGVTKKLLKHFKSLIELTCMASATRRLRRRLGCPNSLRSSGASIVNTRAGAISPGS